MRNRYLLRPELFTLHEADTSFVNNGVRGIQLYMECIQIEVTGTGTVKLPSGVTFPGAYKYSDPGITYNVRALFPRSIHQQDLFRGYSYTLLLVLIKSQAPQYGPVLQSQSLILR
jgi:hypothetical protein